MYKGGSTESAMISHVKLRGDLKPETLTMVSCLGRLESEGRWDDNNDPGGERSKLMPATNKSTLVIKVA